MSKSQKIPPLKVGDVFTIGWAGEDVPEFARGKLRVFSVLLGNVKLERVRE